MEGKKFQNMEKDFIPHEGAIALRGKKKRETNQMGVGEYQRQKEGVGGGGEKPGA